MLCIMQNRLLFSYITCYIQRYILVVNCMCKMFNCHITFSLTWYITYYLRCIVCWETKAVRKIKCMLYNISQPSRWSDCEPGHARIACDSRMSVCFLTRATCKKLWQESYTLGNCLPLDEFACLWRHCRVTWDAVLGPTFFKFWKSLSILRIMR